ncbi:MAG: MFS transporter, partial [Anaerolineaceae bacterium]|nr:MFS transporter [Anaerolineaceae bacterium]
MGDWFNLIASASLIGQLTGSGIAVGGLFVVRMLAPFLISPFAGAWADRYNRRTILIITDITRAITVLCFLMVREPQQVWLLYALTAVQLGISGVFFPTRNAILPDVVAKSDIGSANALSSATWSVMLSLGAALGGLAAGTWGAYPAFIIDAVTFIISAIFVSQIRYQPVSEPDQVDRRRGFLDDFYRYVEGLQYIRQNRFILFAVLLKAGSSLAFGGAFQVIQVTIAEQYFVIGEGGGISLG